MRKRNRYTITVFRKVVRNNMVMLANDIQKNGYKGELKI